MSTHEGGDDGRGSGLFQLPDDLQHLDLVRDVQPVTALGLHGGRAEREHAVERSTGGGLQVRLVGGPGGRHGGVDATAAGRDLLIRLPLNAQGELVRAAAGEDEVGVRVNQAWHHGFSGRIDQLAERQGPHGGEQIRGRADPDDLAPAGGKSAPRKNSQIAHLLAEARPPCRAGEGHKFRRPFDDQVCLDHGASPLARIIHESFVNDPG